MVLPLQLEEAVLEYGAYRDTESITYFPTSSKRIAIPPKVKKRNSNFKQSSTNTVDNVSNKQETNKQES